jgi:hypothetical protein
LTVEAVDVDAVSTTWRRTQRRSNQRGAGVEVVGAALRRSDRRGADMEADVEKE